LDRSAPEETGSGNGNIEANDAAANRSIVSPGQDEEDTSDSEISITPARPILDVKKRKRRFSMYESTEGLLDMEGRKIGGSARPDGPPSPVFSPRSYPEGWRRVGEV
jgi:hypothetical protein